MAQNIHIIVGEDDYLTDRAARAVIDRIVPADLKNDALVEQIDGHYDKGEEVQLKSVSECEASVQTPPFLEPFKVTWWRNVSFLPVPGKRGPAESVKNRLAAFAKSAASGTFPENQHLVMTLSCAPASSQFMKTLKAVAEVQEFASPKYAKDKAAVAANNVVEFASEIGAEIDMSTANALVAKSGTDSRTLLSELEKLKTYLNPGERKITREAVDAVASPGGEEPEPWDLTDAIGARDVAKAIAVLSRYEDDTGNGIRLTNAVERYFRQLAVVKDAQSRGVQRQETLAAAGVAMAPFALRKAYSAARNYSPLELRAARYRFLAVRERVVSSGDASWRSMLEKELVRALSRPGRQSR